MTKTEGRRSSLAIYYLLERVPFLRRSFKAKVLFTAFVGTHIPLLAVLGYFIYREAVTGTYAWCVLATALGATLLGAAITLLTLQTLLKPIDLVLSMFDKFRQDGRLVEPNIDLRDEMGTLVAGTRRTLADLAVHLDHVATHDRTTGLLNAHGLELAVAQQLETSSQTAVLAKISVRNFAELEVCHAREQIEFVTRTIADRLLMLFLEPSLVAVRGRGEFAVLITEDIGESALTERMNQTLAEITAGIRVGREEIAPVCVIGVARANGAPSPDALFRQAESAVLAAEEHDSSNWALASEGGERWRSRNALALELDGALQEEQFFAVYQPRISVQSLKMESLEALVRWNHPERGVLSPGLFIPVAERSDKIVALGRFMLDKAVAQAAAWQQAGRDITIAVNVAASQIHDANFFNDVQASLTHHGLSAQRLELEITETALLQRLSQNIEPLERLRALGIAIALDDFGTGYSSLHYLSRLPVDRVKIDRSFVTRLNITRDRRILQGIVTLCHGLGMKITAEGVETREQAQMLKKLGCDEWQGFLFARPGAHDAIDWNQRPGDKLRDPPASIVHAKESN